MIMVVVGFSGCLAVFWRLFFLTFHQSQSFRTWPNSPKNLQQPSDPGCESPQEYRVMISPPHNFVRLPSSVYKPHLLKLINGGFFSHFLARYTVVLLFISQRRKDICPCGDSPHVTPVSHFRALVKEPMTGQEGRSQQNWERPRVS